MALIPSPKTPVHNESPTAATTGGVISGLAVAALIARWPEYAELWVAVGAVITALVGVAFKQLHKA